MSRRSVVVLVVVCLCAVAPAAAGAAPVTALEVTVQPTATLVDGGTAALVGVTIACPPGQRVRYASVELLQFGIPNPTATISGRRCCGHARTTSVRVPASSFYQPGAATVNVSVGVERRGVLVATGSLSAEITLV